MLHAFALTVVLAAGPFQIPETTGPFVVEVPEELRQVLYFTGPKANSGYETLAALNQQGWKIGDHGHVALHDVRDNPELAKEYGVAKGDTWLLVRNGKEEFRHTGQLTAKQVAELWNDPDNAKRATFTTPAPVEPPKVAGGYPLRFDYSTYTGVRGSVRQHLMGGNHGFTAQELAGLSDSQLYALHSHEHENGNPRRSWRPQKTQPQNVVQKDWIALPQIQAPSAGCPNGNCRLRR